MGIVLPWDENIVNPSGVNELKRLVKSLEQALSTHHSTRICFITIFQLFFRNVHEIHHGQTLKLEKHGGGCAEA